jgi:hypothetical protein
MTPPLQPDDAASAGRAHCAPSAPVTEHLETLSAILRKAAEELSSCADDICRGVGLDRLAGSPPASTVLQGKVEDLRSFAATCDASARQLLDLGSELTCRRDVLEVLDRIITVSRFLAWQCHQEEREARFLLETFTPSASSPGPPEGSPRDRAQPPKENPQRRDAC